MSQELADGLPLEELKKEGFEPTTILDIGAYVGEFYQLANLIWPESVIWSIEANTHCDKILANVFARQNKPYDKYFIKLLSDEDYKKVDYYMNLNQSGLINAGHSYYKENTKSYEGDRLVVEQRFTEKLDSMFDEETEFEFIKIDTQGSELDILRGGKNLVKKAKVILLEVALVEYNENAPLKDEVLQFMNDYGFTKYKVITERTSKHFPGQIVQQDILFYNEKI